ncbi:MAG: LON peptidase substrate-binding domain-containing protein [Planctomycetota bacterium]
MAAGDFEELIRLPEDFDGHVRLFPLPALVLFPHAMQMLHIFEPRYCEMLTEALETDHLIAMATLTGGPSIGAAPPIASTICVGRVVSHVKLESDRHNILLVGIKRAKILTEVDAGRCFRIARVDVLDDLYPPSGSPQRSQLRADLLNAFGEAIPATQKVQEQIADLMSGSMGLGPITDIISHTLPIEVERKLQLLAEPDVDGRAQQLIELLSSGQVQLELPDSENSDSEEFPPRPANLPFPPPFSAN